MNRKTLPAGYRWAEIGEKIKPGFLRWFYGIGSWGEPLGYGATVVRDGTYCVKMTPDEIRNVSV
jgi:hypothetical protein